MDKKKEQKKKDIDHAHGLTGLLVDLLGGKDHVTRVHTHSIAIPWRI